MPFTERFGLPYVAALLLAATAAPAQVPDKFTNLQVLPKDIAPGDLMSMMRGFSFSLGVRCAYCHSGKDGSSLVAVDFPSDALETKKTARLMLRMVDAINREYVGKLTGQPASVVECVTCHRGLSRPRTLQAVLLDEIERSDVSSAMFLYRKLRKEAYGNGQYDFSETTLNLVSESLLHKGKSKESAAIMELNVEVNSPLSNWGYSDLAIAHKQNGELQKAEADFKKILDTDPQNSWAKEEFEKLRQSR
jgi:hypothetical protein